MTRQTLASKDQYLKTPQTIGILGGGQLGRMLAQAALPLGLRCIFLEDAPNCPASALGKVFTSDEFDAFTQAADVFTLEFENTPLDKATELAQQKALHPAPAALAVAQDRLKEKNTFKELGIATVPFMAVKTKVDIERAAQALGLPLVLKTTRGGYDGKGQFVLRQHSDIELAWSELGDSTKDAPLIAEGFIDFEREVSVIAVRGQDGEIQTYPLVQNHHHKGILSHSTAPALNTQDIEPLATQAITKLLEHFNYVGVLTLELFVVKQGDDSYTVLANEIAPRVHNSGHWTIEGAVCSQFENHIRAVAGLPLGNTSVVKPSVMVNIIGEHPDPADVLAIGGAHLHLYDKSERADRKIGHVTLMPINSDDLPQVLAELKTALPNTMGL